MPDTIAAPSLIGYRPTSRIFSGREGTSQRNSHVCFRFSRNEFARGRASINALAIELPQYAYRGREETVNYLENTIADVKPAIYPPENVADKPSLHNPLLRQERMGCGWLGAIFEWEGVLVEDNADLDKKSWHLLSEEEGKPSPPEFVLKRIEGMKHEQAISEGLCWAREPSEVKRIAVRKEEIYQELLGGVQTLRRGSMEFVNVLLDYKIPMALVSMRPRKNLDKAMVSVGVEGCFDAVVAAEDVYRGKPDAEMFVYASRLLDFIPERCIVFGNSNQTVEAAHEERMKCVAVASRHRVYELTAADLVVRHLDELSIVDLKNLADIESPEFGSPMTEMEREEEEPQTAVGVDDGFW